MVQSHLTEITMKNKNTHESNLTDEQIFSLMSISETDGHPQEFQADEILARVKKVNEDFFMLERAYYERKNCEPFNC